MKITRTFLNFEQLKLLTTRRLLSYRDKLLKYKDLPDWDNQKDIEYTKQNPLWISTYDFVINLLSTREHIDK